MVSNDASVSVRVVETVADSTSRDALALPPLYDAVDPDALESLVETMSAGEISFRYAGRRVTVTSDGRIDLDAQSVGRISATLDR